MKYIIERKLRNTQIPEGRWSERRRRKLKEPKRRCSSKEKNGMQWNEEREQKNQEMKTKMMKVDRHTKSKAVTREKGYIYRRRDKSKVDYKVTLRFTQSKFKYRFK